MDIIDLIAQVAIIVGISEVYKRAGFNSKYIPILTLIYGEMFGFIFYPQFEWSKCLMIGIFLGLSASGAFSGVKNVYEGFKQAKEEESEG
jgi:hypothetical protein